MKTSINRVTDTRSIELVWGYIETVVGNALIAAAGDRICTLDLRTGRQAEQRLRADWPGAVLRRDDTRIAALYRESADAPRLAVRGTDFQLDVWRALCEIPVGETCTYGELARAIGRPGAARAVGSAAAANRIALLIPCHRLVPAGGGTGAFRWGPDRKIVLLAAETAKIAIYGKNGTNNHPGSRIS